MHPIFIYSIATLILLFSPVTLLIFDEAGKKLRRWMMVYGKTYQDLTPGFLDPFKVGSARKHASSGAGIVWSTPSIIFFLAISLPDLEAAFQVWIWSLALIPSVFATIIIQWNKIKKEEKEDADVE